MTNRLDRVDLFGRLHQTGTPLLLPNPWDAGSAKVLATLGYRALATTSSGFAGTLGRRDGSVSRDEMLAHCEVVVGATDLPVSADLENGFADTAEGIAETMRLAAATGLAGCSIEDFSGDRADPIYEASLAAERVAAAAEATRSEDHRLILTARAENHLYGRGDLDDTIARLRSFAEAGADVVYAPGLVDLAEIELVVQSVDVPVNVLLRPSGPDVAALAGVSVARVSVGGAFHLVTLAALEKAGRELLHQGTLGFLDSASSAVELRSRAID